MSNQNLFKKIFFYINVGLFKKLFSCAYELPKSKTDDVYLYKRSEKCNVAGADLRCKKRW